MTDDLVKRLRQNITNGWPDDVDLQACNEAADRIEALEAEVLRLGDVLNETPSLALEWPHTSQPTLEFVSDLMKKTTRSAHNAIRNTLYHELYNKRAAMNGDDK